MIYLKAPILFICVMGFLSGLPLALTGSILSAILFDHNVDKGAIGVFGILASCYTFKFLWAPLVDNIKIPLLDKIFKRRISWLLLSQVMITLFVLVCAYITPNKSIALFALCAFFIAFFSATQDIIVDAIRIESLKTEELAAGMATYTLGYRVAMLVSSAGMLYISEYFNWQIAYLSCGTLMLGGVVFTIATSAFINRLLTQKRARDKVSLKQMFVEPFLNFTQNNKHWFSILAFILLYKLSDAYLGMMTLPFLLDIGFTKEEIARIIKIFGFVFTLSGSFVAGSIVSRCKNFYNIIMFCILAQSISNLGFVVQNFAGHNQTTLMIVISIENFISGFGTVVFVAYLSSLCNIKFTATQYALLSSVATLGRTIISTTSGYVVEGVGWNDFFIISALISLPSIIFFHLAYGNNIKKAK